MYDLIITTAMNDERIRAVYLNGSRTNPNIPMDIFQDYDVVYVVTETEPFISDKDWINRFGDILFMQYPDEHPDYPSDKENFYGWLMQSAYSVYEAKLSESFLPSAAKLGESISAESWNPDDKQATQELLHQTVDSITGKEVL